MSNVLRITSEQIENLSGLTDRRIRQIAKEGYFNPPVNGEYEQIATVRGLFKYYRETRERTNNHLADEKLAKAKIDRQISELKLKQQMNELIEVVVVDEMFGVLFLKIGMLLKLKLEIELAQRLVGKNITEIRFELCNVYDEITEIINSNISLYKQELYEKEKE